MRLTLANRRRETHDIETFMWRVEDGAKPDFKPGQFLKWTLRDDNPDERGNWRYFSISASPTEQYLKFSTKFNPEGSSFKKRVALMSPGDSIEGFGPLGSFVLPETTEKPLVLVAGGIGITPFRSMLKYMTDQQIPQAVTLIYACRSDQDMAFHEELMGWVTARPDWRLIYVLSTPSQTISTETGRLSGERVLSLAGGHEGKLFYFSGPEPMVKELYEQALAQGLPPEQAKTDYFPGYAAH